LEVKFGRGDYTIMVHHLSFSAGLDPLFKKIFSISIMYIIYLKTLPPNTVK